MLNNTRYDSVISNFIISPKLKCLLSPSLLLSPFLFFLFILQVAKVLTYSSYISLNFSTFIALLSFQIAKVQIQFMEALQVLFERHKAQAGYPNLELRIV